MKNILEKINTEYTYFEGGCGSILQANGLQPGELPEKWNIDHSDVISKLHFDYTLAGANIHKLNTFGLNSLKFNDIEGNYTMENIAKCAVNNCRLAINAALNGVDLNGNALSDNQKQYISQDQYIALDVGPLGKLLKPIGDLSFDDAYSIFSETIKAGLKAGVDLILIETINDLYEAKAAILAAKENSNLPVLLTCAYDERGKLLTGADPKCVVATAEGLGVDAVGINCSLGPDMMIPVVEELCKYASIPVICCPNAGLPRTENGKTVYDVGPKEFISPMMKIADCGTRIFGGCCGTTPDHIKEVVHSLTGKSVIPITYKEASLITSYTHAVEFGNKPILIGERINPTGKSKFKQALRDHNIDYILGEGLTQQDKGADVLDVNVGLPEIDEVALMEEVVYELQAVTDLPLQIDTTNPVAMENALRHYNGKAMINSVNGKEEIMAQIFPLVKKYGGLCVALTIDEDGIPTTAEGRLKIVDKIYKKAAEYGINKKDIIIDPLAMSISADSESANVTLDALALIKERYNGLTSLGVSNISFGLPNRDFINSTFFALAMENGLNAAIMNPNSVEMMKAYYTFCALKGYDENCMAYIEYATNLVPATVQDSVASAPTTGKADDTQSNSDGLVTAITKGLKDRAAANTAEYLKTMKPIDIIDGYLIPALDIVGKGFEAKTVFLPQLLMAAEAAKSAFDVIKEQIAAQGNKQASKGQIIIATVKGDIHDIGKNIVKVLLENYGYDVIDLGKDVDPELIVNTAKDNNIALIGLSALMTTTVPAMEETIKLLREAKLDTKVCVGGAVLTQEYADMIGADKYAKDAMETVRYAEEIFVR